MIKNNQQKCKNQLKEILFKKNETKASSGPTQGDKKSNDYEYYSKLDTQNNDQSYAQHEGKTKVIRIGSRGFFKKDRERVFHIKAIKINL